MIKGVDHPPLGTSITIIVVVVISDIHEDDRHFIPTMVSFSLQAFLQLTLPQATQLPTEPLHTLRRGDQLDNKMMEALG
jgi:hypothetical protein